jgi:hypothetical protein
MDRTQTPKPDLPLDVLEIVGKIEQQTRGTLESCVRGEFIVVGLILDMEKVTEIMQASATKSFRVRAEYYESQPGFCLEWLDEVVDETVAATLKLVPFRFLLSGYYKGGVRAIREGLETELRGILKLRVEAMQLRKAKGEETVPGETLNSTVVQPPSQPSDQRAEANKSLADGDGMVQDQSAGGASAEPTNPPTLDALLDGAKSLETVIGALPSLTSDRKLTKKLSAVAHYRWYSRELNRVKAAAKKFQTAQSLQDSFPDLALWQIVDRSDHGDLVKGDFDPGRFAWCLVQRKQGRRSVDDRTLRYYEQALRAAKLLS